MELEDEKFEKRTGNFTEQDTKTDREHERILNEIETTDTAFIGASLRAVYEGNDHAKFLERLDSRIKQHDRDIEKMCNFHYQGFIESITELINVKGDADRLRAQTQVINKELQESGKEVARKSDDVIQCQLQQRNVASAIEKLTVCLPVLQMYAKMSDQMRAGRYYSALKTLEQLEHTYLPHVYSYRFCEIMMENIPKIRQNIKDVSMSELKDFLENVRKNSDKIGKVAMKQVEKERNLEQNITQDETSTALGITHSPKQESPTEVDQHTVLASNEHKTNHINVKNADKRKEALNKIYSNSPKHQPRLNPFDDEVSDEEDEVLETRNPFDDPNPFNQDLTSNSKNKENGLCNPFMDTPEEPINSNDVIRCQVNERVENKRTQKESQDFEYKVSAIVSQTGIDRKHEEGEQHLQNCSNNLTSSNPFETSDSSSSDVQVAENGGSCMVNRKKADSTNSFCNDPHENKFPCNENIKSGKGSDSLCEFIKNNGDTSIKNEIVVKKEDIPVKPPPRRKKKKKVAYTSSQDDAPSVNKGVKPSKADHILTLSYKNEQRPPSAVTSAHNSCLPIYENSSPLKNRPTTSDQFVNGALKKERDRKGYHARRAKLVEDMMSPRWRKTKDWLMPRIYDDLSASDLVDFSPVYKCLHIHGLVDSRSQFETYYRTQRRKQARLVLQPTVSMQDNPDAYAHFFHQIVGFFVVEDHVLHTAPSLITRQWINDLWDMAISKLISSLRTDTGYSSDAVVMLKVKNLIVIFADTLKAYGFSVTRLFNLLMDMRDQYGEILLKHWAQKFSDIFSEDNYTPMLVESDMEAQALLDSFPYEDPNFDQAIYPRKLPFSRFVPRIYNEIKNFIQACLEYCKDLHVSSTEEDDMVRKSTNLLLTRTLATGLQSLVAKSSLGLTELVQIIVNTTHLESSCRHVEDFVQSVTGVRVGSAHSAKLVGVSTFKDARNETESQIYNKLNSKIGEFFELAEYSWSMKEPAGMASRYLLDLIAFLKHNFQVFTNLPANVAQTACMSACRHINTKMMELIMDSDIKIVTMAALQQFNLDVMQCELFASSEPVPGFQDGALQMSFVEIRQLLDLFLSWDWSSYLADYGSGSSKYLRVNPNTALSLLEKIKEDRGHRNIFTSLSKHEREKKKLLETVVRQLRGIVNNAA